jgi:twitching motility protein PilT
MLDPEPPRLAVGAEDEGASMRIRDLLNEMIAHDASDLHIKVGSPPGIRVHGELLPIEGIPPLTAEQTHVLVSELLDEELEKRFEEKRELDFSRQLEGLARFRVNVFHPRGTRAAVMRAIPIEVPLLESMGFPDVLKTLARKPRGLVLVTGPTGSGKSTTLAAMIDYINRHDHSHILTLEDPIEFIHRDKRCYVNQREIGSDSPNFLAALRSALREDPDIILVGEMRDLETISLAITAAETGHLVFGTLHTTSAIQTVDRIIDVFPHEAQAQVRTQLSVTLQGVISQTLLPKIGGGRACAQEIMTGTDAVRACIREGKTPQLLNVLQTGNKYGMQTLESALIKLVTDGKVLPEDAIGMANSPDQVRAAFSRSGRAPATAGASMPPPAAPRPNPTVRPVNIPTVAPPSDIPRTDDEARGDVDGKSAFSPLDDFEQFRRHRRNV